MIKYKNVKASVNKKKRNMKIDVRNQLPLPLLYKISELYIKITPFKQLQICLRPESRVAKEGAFKCTLVLFEWVNR